MLAKEHPFDMHLTVFYSVVWTYIHLLCTFFQIEPTTSMDNKHQFTTIFDRKHQHQFIRHNVHTKSYST